MGGDMHVRNRSATASGLVLLFLMSTLLVVSPTAMADPNVDQMSWYQAQGLSAAFDPQTEVTTITWDNIDEFDNRMAELLDATYSVYRHEGPLNSNTLAEADLVATVEACADTIGGGGGTNYLNCRSSSIHPGHVIEYPVPPGENAFVNYTVTTQMGNGTVYAMFLPGDSVTVVGVQESTQAIRTPYNLAGSFDRVTSTTTLTWVPYHILPGGDVIPTEGPDAATILVYRSEDMPITRSNITTMLITNQAQLIANLSAETSTYDVTINAGTQRSAYYAISYYLPNWNGPAFDYVDFRFLSNNAMTESILEDNTPPASPVGVSANFQSDVNNGTAVTWIYWEDALGEVSESYQIYMSGNSFSTIEDPNVTLVGTVTEDVEAFAYTLPTGRFGSAHYCVVTVDSFGVYNAGTTSNSCTGAVYEDAFSSWIKEPTLVEAAYLGQSTTQVTWVDQLGITGERYHIWHANDRLNGAEFIENQTITWLGTVDEGVGVFNVTVPTGMDRDDSFYYVTSEALYGHLTGPAMYTGLVQNVAGPVYEDTKSPRSPDITTVEVFGDELLARITWINEDTEFGERYYIYRHFGEPFAESVVSNLTDEGWEYMFGPIEEGNGLTLVSDVAVEPGLDREVYYAVITEDAYGNVNPTIFEGDNTKRVLEDTLAPDIELTMIDATGAPHNSPSLVSGDYSMLVSLSQDIGDAPVPTITISSADGTAITSENAIMSMIQDNLNNPDKGPVFSIDFAIQSTTAPGALGIVVDVQDASANTNQLQSVDQWFVDAQSPQVTVFSPSSSTDEDGSKYLYGNEVTVTASATDDVRIDRMQYKITYNLDGETLSLPWTDTEDITWMDDNKTAVMSMSIPSGNFAIGRHQVGVQAVDAAGNVRSKTVVFTIDYCNHKADGTTQCVYENEVAGIPDPVEVFPGATDPPYVIIWGLAGLLLLTMVAAFMVVITSMRSPKAKKKGDGDEDADEDWMSEFIGTSQDLDMAAITGTEAKKDPESERKSLDDDDDEDDPFAVNKPTQKRRRRKSSEPEEDEDEDDDDEEDGFMEALEEAKPKKRSPPRKRRAVSKSSDDDGASKRRTPPKRRAVKRKSED